MNDRRLSPHFSLFDLTATTHADLQQENRNVTDEEERKLGEVANLLEEARTILGCDLDVHSGRRFLALNQRVGGSVRSQHQRSEAADFSPQGPDTEESISNAWQKLANAARAGKIKLGQLILENDGKGREGRVWWVHISLGVPWRDQARCGEIASMTDGKFTMISKV